MNRTQAVGVVVHHEFVKAFANGAKIQFFCEDSGQWEDAVNPMFDAFTAYRMKPVEYRELNIDEAFALLKNKTFIYHKDNQSSIDRMIICCVHHEYVKFKFHAGCYADGEFSYSRLKNDFVFADGTPVAAKV